VVFKSPATGISTGPTGSGKQNWYYLYRARNLVEQFFNKIKQCRRIATRYDKLAAIWIWLRAYERHALVSPNVKPGANQLPWLPVRCKTSARP
jgi:hypothetical protein